MLEHPEHPPVSAPVIVPQAYYCSHNMIYIVLLISIYAGTDIEQQPESLTKIALSDPAELESCSECMTVL